MSRPSLVKFEGATATRYSGRKRLETVESAGITDAQVLEDFRTNGAPEAPQGGAPEVDPDAAGPVAFEHLVGHLYHSPPAMSPRVKEEV